MTQSDAPMTFHLEPEIVVEGVFETEDVFAEIQQQLNKQFMKHPLYFGINVAVPHRFLGKRHLEWVARRRQEQDEENAKYRRVRLRDESPPQKPS